MIATIISLPTSAPEPVQNPRHRGRYPSSVVPSWKVIRQWQERASRMTEAERAKMKAKTDADYERGFERGREEAQMERVAMDALRNLAAVMSYLTKREQDDEGNE